MFKHISSDFELLDVIRKRHQMWSQNLDMLEGIISGFQLARGQQWQSHLDGFGDFIRNKKQQKYAHWSELIHAEAKRREYEVSIFFDYLDEYRDLQHDVLRTMTLTQEQRHFDFKRHLKISNMDCFEAPLDPPHTIKIIRLPNDDLHVFEFDEQGKKYYENPRMSDLAYIEKWLKECYNLTSEE